jgi:hypothetical protein
LMMAVMRITMRTPAFEAKSIKPVYDTKQKPRLWN